MDAAESSAHRIVSSESDQLILVDENDNERGIDSKARCHDGDGLLHRAFSIFLFDDAGRVLLQRRAANKRLWPGYWSNACCSHPRSGESLQYATARRLEDELNLSADLHYVYQFIYQAKFADVGSEHELCHVYLGRVAAPVVPNESEIDGIRFVEVDELERELRSAPDDFTPWFKLEWQALRSDYAQVSTPYMAPSSD